ncbi:DUF1740-domain-containing protein [Pleurostoma richardsiae]|uniref:DUF1740-domain-containing protein n=1 Tax=Pleurostoma richardsiae TaxID=41990 RepID=A0AA38RAX0_9PEZI|nr:DUF1740-domain-containing protein [Pleurostoma richardsiae]
MSSRDDKKPTVPKFSSFKPKPANTPAKEDDIKGRGKDEDRERRSSPREDRRHKGHSHRHRLERRSSPSATKESSRPPSVKEADPKAEDSLFSIDKRGDPLIVRYGGNDRNRIPAYRRYGFGRVLGADGRLTVIADGRREVFSLGGHREGASAFRDRSFLAKVSRRKPRLLKPRQEPEHLDPLVGRDEDFLPLSGSHKRKRAGDGLSASDDDGGDKAHYRSIQGKAKAKDFVDSDLDTESDSSGDEENDQSQDPIRRRAIELSRQTREHPEDIDSWMQLIDLQAALLQLGETVGDFQKTPDEVQGLANVRVSLLEEALPHAITESDRERILLSLMREGAKIWTPKNLAKKWAEISKETSSFALWKARLDFELTDLVNLTSERLKQFHLERLHFLRNQMVGATAQDKLVSICNEMIYVFLRTTRYLEDVGFTELAVAAWQALLEMTFARPPNGPGDPVDSDISSSFRDFWESEVARIGEDNAKGWRHFTEEMDDLPEPRPNSAPEVPATRDAYKAWASVEQQQACSSRMPARTMDEDTEDDPFRVVMYSDIEPLLFYIPPSTLPLTKASIFDSFLLFCRLPPASGMNPYVRSAYADPFIYQAGSLFERNLQAVKTDQTQDEDDGSRKRPHFSQGATYAALSSDVLFAGPDWFNILENWKAISADNKGTLESGWILRTARQVALTFGFAEAAEYSLALAWNSEPSSVKKAARSLLKQYPSRVSLYNAYALAESANGNKDVARKVLDSATSQGLGLGSHDSGGQLLWNTWAWMELADGDKDKALGRLVASAQSLKEAASSPEGLGSAPAQVLKARQSFVAARDYLLSSSGVDVAWLFAESHALLEYLTGTGPQEPISDQQGNISAAIASILAFSDDVVSRGQGESAAHERLLQSAGRLLYHHAKHGPFRPTYLREQLQRFITLFPRNTIFLALFAWAEPSLRIDDPVRDLLTRLVLVDSRDSITSRIFAITHELRVGTVHSTRTAFECALDSYACKGNISLWRAYIRFCYDHKELRAKAKDVYYRAIASCPWSKEIAMEAFTTLARDMSSSELRAVFSTLSEKGTRLHIDLEEFLSRWGKAQKQTQT